MSKPEEDRSPSPTPEPQAGHSASPPRTPLNTRGGTPATTSSGRPRASSHRTTVHQTPNGGNVTKGPWTLEEDERLRAIIEEKGAQHWSGIAAKLGTRSGKQCRERWHNHLSPDVDKRPWTPQEEEKLERLLSQYGNRWAEIARHMPGRTDNAIKNHVNSSRRRHESHQRQLEAARAMAVVSPTIAVSPVPEKKKRGRKRKEQAAPASSAAQAAPTTPEYANPHESAASALATLPTSAPDTPLWSNAVSRTNPSFFFTSDDRQQLGSSHGLEPDAFAIASSAAGYQDGEHRPAPEGSGDAARTEYTFEIGTVANVVYAAVSVVNHQLQSSPLPGLQAATSPPGFTSPSIVRQQSPYLTMLQTPKSRARASPPTRRRNSRPGPQSPPGWESPQGLRTAADHQPLLSSWASPTPTTPSRDVGTPSRGTEYTSTPSSFLMTPGFTTEASFVEPVGFSTPQQQNRSRRSLFGDESPRKRTARGLEPITQQDENQTGNDVNDPHLSNVYDGTAEFAGVAAQYLRQQGDRWTS